MKKIISSCMKAVIVAAMLVFTAGTSRAAGCADTVDLLCELFGKMTQKINRITTLDEFENIDFDRIIDDSRLNSIPASCDSYVLTAADKNKLNKSLDNLVNAMAAKCSGLSNGYISRADAMELVKPVGDVFRRVVSKSRTIGELGENMYNAFD